MNQRTAIAIGLFFVMTAGLVAKGLWPEIADSGSPDSALPVRAPLQEEGESLFEALEVSPTGYLDATVVGWRTPDLVQTYLIQRSEDTSTTDVVVVDNEKDVGTGNWAVTAHMANCTFNANAMDSAGRDFFVLAGVDEATGETVVERWKLVQKVGVPGAPPKKVFARTQVFRGSLPIPTIEVGVDPDRRFVLLLQGESTDRSLYQVSIATNATPVLLYSVTAQPVLGQAWMMNPLQHADLGRIWLVSGMTDTDRGQTLILVDAANDGQFDSPPIIGSQESLESAGIFDETVILDRFKGTF